MIGDANGREILGLKDLLGHSFANDVLSAAPDFVGIVFDPPGCGIDLLVLFLGLRNDAAGVVENDEARAGGALIERSEISRHRVP